MNGDRTGIVSRLRKEADVLRREGWMEAATVLRMEGDEEGARMLAAACPYQGIIDPVNADDAEGV